MEEYPNIREYQFNVSGFIPGVPGMFSAGQRVTVNEDTKEVLSVWPKPIEPPPPALVEEPTEPESEPVNRMQ